jgi:hypothetical protein
MNKRKLTTILLSTVAALGFAAEKQFTVVVKNPSAEAKEDAPVVVRLTKDNAWQSAIVTLDGKEIPSQLDDLDQDGWMDELAFTTNIGKKETQRFSVTLKDEEPSTVYPNRTFAEIVLRNPKVKDKNKHNYYVQELSLNKECYDPYHLPHHHGVAFENELIAMRIYFDERQTIDLYGKYNKGLELKETQFYTTKEQKAKGYGDDILWVGNTFGFGALRGYSNGKPAMLSDVNNRDQRIISFGPVRTIVEVEDRGWKPQGCNKRMNLTIRYTLWAGHRDMEVDVHLSHPANGVGFSTGLINMKNSQEFTDHKGLRGMWGSDWPTGKADSVNWKIETIGMGIYIPDSIRLKELPADKDNYGFQIGTEGQDMHYMLTYSSDDESYGYHNAKDWFNFLKEWRKELDRPVTVTIAK